MNDLNDKKILVIDDDEAICRSMVQILEKLGLAVHHAFCLNDGIAEIRKHEFEIVFLDVHLPDGNGIEIIPAIMDAVFPPQVIILTGYSDPDGAALAIENGAWDYVQKPASAKEIRLHALRALEFREQKRQAQTCIPFEAPNILGSSQAIRQSMIQAAQIANSDANVLITGQTGTGKEIFAKAIHANSARRKGSFVVVDCSLLSGNMIESVLFGHEKGAFTGAEKQRSGLINLANGGTLFLDEVGELPEFIQSSFLRVLQEKRFRPMGSDTEIFSDFRVICATNKDLEKMADEKSFRSDLLYRLKSLSLELPPLKDRNQDVIEIAQAFIKRFSSQQNQITREMSPDFCQALSRYHWPGNVRELINTLETSLVSSQLEKVLFAFHLPLKIRTYLVKSSVSGSNKHPAPSISGKAPDRRMPKYKDFIEVSERNYFQSLYSETNGNINDLIHRSGLSRAVIYRKLKKHNITP